MIAGRQQGSQISDTSAYLSHHEHTHARAMFVLHCFAAGKYWTKDHKQCCCFDNVNKVPSSACDRSDGIIHSCLGRAPLILLHAWSDEFERENQRCFQDSRFDASKPPSKSVQLELQPCGTYARLSYRLAGSASFYGRVAPRH